jgi:hypothetical protein
MITCVPANCVGNGSDVAEVPVPLARLAPNIEIIAPGDDGSPAAKLAEFRMPPVLMIGGSAFGVTAPPACTVPSSEAAGGELCAVTVIVTFSALRGAHVADHIPPCKLLSASGASPFEKAAVTRPLENGWPQSSATVTSIGVGHPAGSENPWPMAVSAGSNRVGAHMAFAESLAEPLVDVPL